MVVILLCLSTLLSGNQKVRAASKGEQLFGTNCAACHKDGKNLIEQKKPVIGSAKLAKKETLKSFLLKPSGNMPPFPDVANNAADLAALYDYCKGLK